MNRDVPVVAVGVRAVDVGYFNLKYSLGRKLVGGANTIATSLFPALAPRLTTKEVMKDPGVDACIVNVRGADYIVGPDSVDHTSPSDQQAFDLEYSATDRYHALMLGALNYMADDAGAGQEFVIGRLVLGLPLNTYHKNVQILARRAVGEHLMRRVGSQQCRRVTVKDVHVMAQPHGALLDFGVAHPGALKDNRGTLVIDPGGGTLDWFLARGTTPNWTRSGAHPKAMLHCAYAISNLINPRWRTQYEIVEIIDRALRNQAEEFQVGPRRCRHAAAIHRRPAREGHRAQIHQPEPRGSPAGAEPGGRQVARQGLRKALARRSSHDHHATARRPPAAPEADHLGRAGTARRRVARALA
jgi:PRTRC genetic system protein D